MDYNPNLGLVNINVHTKFAQNSVYLLSEYWAEVIFWHQSAQSVTKKGYISNLDPVYINVYTKILSIGSEN